MSAVLIIGGCDSSGGAGIARDLSTLCELKVRALCAITAVTAQTDAALLDSQLLPEALVRAQIAAAFATSAVQAVKVGMLGNASAVRALAQALAAHREVPLVLDPVLVSSSGGMLLDAPGREALMGDFLAHITLLTPNLPEAATLLGAPEARTPADALEQGHELLRRGARAVLLKGGHASGPQSTDWLFTHAAPPAPLSAPRIAAGLRGSGCALASAIAAYLSQGAPLLSACGRAKEYVGTLLQRSA